MKPVLSERDLSWMAGPKGEEPVLCRLVWVPHNSEKHGSRRDVIRNWAMRNRLFTVDENGFYQRIHFEYGVGFYTAGRSGNGTLRVRIAAEQFMQNAYLFTNRMH